MLGEDSLNVVFDVTSLNGNGSLHWIIADYANGKLVKSVQYSGGYRERLDVIMRTGRHNIVLFCSPRTSSCSFNAAEATLAVNTSADSWMRDIWNVASATMDVSVSKSSAAFNVNAGPLYGYLDIVTTDVDTFRTGGVARTEVIIKNLPNRLSLLNGNHERENVSVIFQTAPPIHYIPVIVPEGGINDIAVTIRAYNRIGTVISTRHISRVPIKRREPTFLVGPLLDGSDKDWKLFEAKDSLALREVVPWL